MNPSLVSLLSGQCEYMSDLLALDACRSGNPTHLPLGMRTITTPLVQRTWERSLAEHPDQRLAKFIMDGIKNGFRIGFNYCHQCRSSLSNMASAQAHPEAVSKYLEEEIAKGRIIGPLNARSLPEVHVSPFGVIPKGSTGKWRLIVNLSAPEGRSVNDGIQEKWCSLSYISVDDAARTILEKGRGALMAKVDIKSAFRIVPVHPEDRWLLGMRWEGKLYIDTVLPFGLRSAPKLFNTLADAMEWVVRQEGVDTVFHYLDDFLIIGSPASPDCDAQLAILCAAFERHGIPIAPEKLEGPSSCLTFLGIELDTMAMEMRLPQAKLAELQVVIHSWVGRRSCEKRELCSLIGKLQHATKVVRPGRTFLRRMFEQLAVAKKMHHHVRLNQSFRSDLAWWNTFLAAWNGVSLLSEVISKSPDHVICTDASGSWGCGAVWGTCWLQYKWGEPYQQEAITQKELLPIVFAAAVWGHLWQDCTTKILCDNQAVVAVINSGYSREPQVMHLLRCLFFITAKFRIRLHCHYLPGPQNDIADAVSRNNLASFFFKVPDAHPSPTLLPVPLIDLLVNNQPDWTSQIWIQLFRNCFQLD